MDERNGLFFFYEDWLYSYVSEGVVYVEIEIWIVYSILVPPTLINQYYFDSFKKTFVIF